MYFLHNIHYAPFGLLHLQTQKPTSSSSPQCPHSSELRKIHPSFLRSELVIKLLHPTLLQEKKLKNLSLYLLRVTRIGPSDGFEHSSQLFGTLHKVHEAAFASFHALNNKIIIRNFSIIIFITST